MNSKRIALDNNFLVEFMETNYSLSTDNSALHLHNNYDTTNKILVVGADTQYSTTGNVREFSFYSDYNGSNNNWLLNQTPFSYSDIESAVHTDGLVSGITTAIPYKIVRLHIRAGWSFPTNTSAYVFRINATYNGRLIELLNFYAPSTSSILTPNKSNIYLDGELYNSYVEFKILDLSALSITHETDLQGLFNTLTGLGNFNSFDTSLLSDYNLELGFVPSTGVFSDNLTGANTGGNTYSFERFDTVSYSSNTKLLTDSLSTISTTIARENSLLKISMSNNGSQSVAEYLNELTSDIDYLDINHYVSITEFDSDSNNLGLRTTRLSNDITEYGIVEFIPILQDLTESITINVRTRIQAFDTGLDISKFVTVSLTGADVDAMRRSNATATINLTQLEIVNNINRQVVQMTNSGGGSTNIKLKSNTVYVHWNKVNVTSFDGGATFESSDIDKGIRLYDTSNVYSFEFTMDGVLKTLPNTKMFIAESPKSEKIYEFQRDGGTKVLFRLNRGMFRGTQFQIYDEALNVIASFIIK